MTHNFTFPTDQDAAATLSAVVDEVRGGILQRRWVAARGDSSQHRVAWYRRSIENRRSHQFIDHGFFDLPNLGDDILGWFDVNDLPDLGPWEFDYAQFNDDPRRSLLVVERGDQGSTRRAYVGPLAPMAMIMVSGPQNILLNPNDATLMIRCPPHFDTVPGSDYDWSRWPGLLAEQTVNYIAGLSGAVFNWGGQPAVPSWRHGRIEHTVSRTPSLIPAMIRSRGLAGSMGPTT